ncbi:AraC family transcriptional regulator [Streptomyces sp. NP160]|uniref:AraC family transcriptional regulator n=1 Tax=Streptomyces sp. NP160 TaxID=2586637 RepID=UPI001117D3ED|nr:AraC family transcriptional regulator [Streptomyces sp. NP160]TNM64412.1 AraC family transcriptional regulator [Streptomyces sp. NP160]
MDAVAGLLDAPRAREAFLLRCSMAAPWAVEVRDRAPLTLLAVVRGSAAVTAGGERHRLDAGGVAVLRGPAPYVVADADGAGRPADPCGAARTPVQAVIHPGQRCTAPDGGPQSAMGEVGVRAWGNAPDRTARDVLLVGTYAQARAVSEDLLAALPAVVLVPGEDWCCPYLPLLAEEAALEAPGQQAVLDRLLDLVLVAVLRRWLEEGSAARRAGQGWWSGADAVVAGALRLLHEQPERGWTLPALAAAVGVSRATLARRFTAAVGEPPMAHLARWRLAVAADLLDETDAPLDAVARRVGYGSGSALSAAFTRERGTSPSEHRLRRRAGLGSGPAAASALDGVASSTGWRV